MHILWKSFLKISPGPPGMTTQGVYCTTAGNTIHKDYNLTGAPEAVQCTISNPYLVSLYCISYIISVLSFSNSYWMNVGTSESIIYVTYLFFLFSIFVSFYMALGGGFLAFMFLPTIPILFWIQSYCYIFLSTTKF